MLVERILKEASMKVKSIRKDEDNIEIICYVDKKEAGQLLLEYFMPEIGWYWFEDIIDEDRYEDLFQNMSFYMVNHVETKHSFKDLGVGTMLMNSAIEFVKKQKVKFMVLNASPLDLRPTSGLVNWYQRFGFAPLVNQGKNVIMIKKM